jgi:hypothetical protein
MLEQMECARTLIGRSVYFTISVFEYSRAKICINNSMRTSLWAVELFYFLTDPYDIVKRPFFGIGAYFKFTGLWNRGMRYYGEEMNGMRRKKYQMKVCSKELCGHSSRTNLHSFCILL